MISASSQVKVALIGLAGMVVAAIIANYDKLSERTEVTQAEYSVVIKDQIGAAIIDNFEVGRIDGSISKLDILLDEAPAAEFLLNQEWPVISKMLRPGNHRLELRADIWSEAGRIRSNCVAQFDVKGHANFRPRIVLMKTDRGARIRGCEVLEMQSRQLDGSQSLAGSLAERICAIEAGIDLEIPNSNISASALEKKQACIERHLATKGGGTGGR